MLLQLSTNSQRHKRPSCCIGITCSQKHYSSTYEVLFPYQDFPHQVNSSFSHYDGNYHMVASLLEVATIQYQLCPIQPFYHKHTTWLDEGEESQNTNYYGKPLVPSILGKCDLIIISSSAIVTFWTYHQSRHLILSTMAGEIFIQNPSLQAKQSSKHPCKSSDKSYHYNKSSN